MAVGNRVGDNRITKIAATEERCVDSNGVPGIQTSTGAADVPSVPGGRLRTVELNAPTRGHGTAGDRVGGGGKSTMRPARAQRPILVCGSATANTRADIFRFNGDTGVCRGSPHNGKRWRSDLRRCGQCRRRFLGDNPRRADSLRTSIARPSNTPTTSLHGIHTGSASTRLATPWVATWENGSGAHHVYRLDTVSGNFVDAGASDGPYRGMNLDRAGRAWVAGNGPCRLAAFDTRNDTLISNNIPLPGCQAPVGVSIDLDGFVWVVDQNGTAYKVHPHNHTIELTVTGLVGPYTYSDMTGAGLNLVVNPPG